MRRRWSPGPLTWAITLCGAIALAAGLYPSAATWISSYNQSLVIRNAATSMGDTEPAPTHQLEQARAYNAALVAGVRLDAGGNVPVVAANAAGTTLVYDQMLVAADDGLMARIRIPSIGVDLPVFHGTSERTLLRGAGHLEGTHLPVGGEGTRAVITAHRGLAEAAMFTALDRVTAGDVFTVEVFGEPLVYRVRDVQVIDPADSATLIPEPGRDLVTLITCTPLGINSHRIVVTGERITPTPPDALAAAGDTPEGPGFPWWAVILLAGIGSLSLYLGRRGFLDVPRPDSSAAEVRGHVAGSQGRDGGSVMPRGRPSASRTIGPS